MQNRRVVDFIITEYPNGLHVLGVSNPPSQISPLNANIPSFLHIMMAFALTYLYDDGALFLFYPDSSSMKREVARFFMNYKLKIKDK